MFSHLLITIWRYTLLELWRLVLLTAVTIVAVIGFALTVKFFADGALGPLQTLKFMAIASIPMLQYALPFAGGFAATMVYHRLTSENELTGARAAGISHRALLVPVAITGIVLAIILSILSEFVIPRMLLSMESLVTESVTKIIVNSVRNGKQIEAGRLRIYADDVQVHPDNPNELVLMGVVVQRLNGTRTITSSVIARSAQVSLRVAREVTDDGQTRRGSTIVRLRLHDASGDAGQGVLMQTDLFEYSVAIPSRFEDDPKFLTFSQLRAALRNPDMLSPVRDRANDLARHVALRIIVARAMNEVQANHRLEMTVAGGSTYVMHASKLTWDHVAQTGWLLEPLAGNDYVEVDRIDVDGTVTLRASLATLSVPWTTPGAIVEVGDDTSDLRVEFDLALDDVRTISPAGEIGQRDRHVLRRLQVQDDPTPGLVAKSSAQLKVLAEPYLAIEKPDGFITRPYRNLVNRTDRILREIKGKQHERIAMSVACLVMSLAGAVTAIRLASAQPLTVYLWSFFPSLFTVLAISIGPPMVERNPSPIGYLVLWGAVAAFSVYTLWALRSLRSS